MGNYTESSREAQLLSSIRQLQPHLPIAPACAAVTTGGGILFGLTVVRNAVSTIVVSRTSTPILPNPK
jgi:hypothetical protein